MDVPEEAHGPVRVGGFVIQPGPRELEHVAPARLPLGQALWRSRFRLARPTLARLARIKGEYVMQIASGNALAKSREDMKGVRERWPQIFIRLDGNYEEFLQNCRSNHLHWAYGDFKDELVEFCKIQKIKPTPT